jgi:AcrR family transcriptional regulator
VAPAVPIAAPPGAMRHLVFHSRAQAGLREPEIAAMAAQAIARNRALGITGRLFQVGREFVQISEGPIAPVGRLYVKMAFDPRHAAVTTLTERGIGERAYADWTLQHAPSFTALQAAAPAALAPFLGPPAPLPRPRPTGFESDLQEGDLRQPPLQARSRESLARLLETVQAVLAREGSLGRLTLEAVAREAGLAHPSAYRYVPDVHALLRMGVRRFQEKMNQRFIAFLRDRDFPDAAALAEAAVDFTIARALMPMPLGQALVHQLVRRGYHQLRPNAVMALAACIMGGLPAECACRAIGAPRFAAGMLAMATLVRAIWLEDPVNLRQPATRALLLAVMLGALQAPPWPEAAARARA